MLFSGRTFEIYLCVVYMSMLEKGFIVRLRQMLNPMCSMDLDC